MASDQLEAGAVPQLRRIVDCAQTGAQMVVEERLLQRAQAAQVPDEDLRRAGQRADARLRRQAASIAKPRSSASSATCVARGHIAKQHRPFARLHGAVMLGLENTWTLRRQRLPQAGPHTWKACLAARFRSCRRRLGRGCARRHPRG